MVDVALVSRKLATLAEYVGELKAAEEITWEVYQRDVRAKAFVERYLHLSIETVIDIANHFVSFYAWREPAGYRDLFAVLQENGVVPQKELPTFQRMAAFRNLLVHRYDKVEDELVYGVFRSRLGDFERFAALVKKWVGEQDSDGKV